MLELEQTSIFLGLPLGIRRPTTKWVTTHGKIRRQTLRLERKFWSQAGRLILLNSVLTNLRILDYMAAFKPLK